MSAGARRTATLVAIVVSRPVLRGVLVRNSQLIKDGHPGGSLAAVVRDHRTVGGQPSTSPTVTGDVGHQVVCTTPAGMPTEVVVSGTHAVLSSLSSTVAAGDLAPPPG